jgi:hypothetical protein
MSEALAAASADMGEEKDAPLDFPGRTGLVRSGEPAIAEGAEEKTIQVRLW